jgi:hypothetical protein
LSFFSCSLPCFKAHKSQCTSTSAESTTEVAAPSAAGSSEQNPTAAAPPSLDRSILQDPRVEKLFEQYPNLRAKLKYIFDTAAGNEDGHERPRSNARGQVYKDSPQKRMARALRVLTGQLESDTAESSGLKAFAELVAELNAQQGQQETLS